MFVLSLFLTEKKIVCLILKIVIKRHLYQSLKFELGMIQHLERRKRKEKKRKKKKTKRKEEKKRINVPSFRSASFIKQNYELKKISICNKQKINV